MALGLLATLRDEAAHLPRFLNLLEQLDGRPEWGPLVCSFYENDSHDGTAAVLAAARNRALEPLLQQQLDWLLVIDADLQVQPAQVLALHRLLLRYPEAAMVCASAVQNVPDVLGEGPWSYYDSWALRDRQGRGGITFAANPFCDPPDRWRWMAGLPVPVAAAFGGMALLPMAVVRQQGLQWQGDQGCEHWAFCAGARRAGPVLACPTVRPVVWHAQPPRWSAAYAAGVRSQLTA